MTGDGLGTAGDAGDAFGEDLRRSAQLALDVAHAHCGACLDYHMLYPLKRLYGPSRALPDREALAATVARLVAARATQVPDVPVHVAIAGAADTGVLATAARGAAAALGAATPQRVRFTILDRCRTPLVLCENFGRQNGFAVEARAVDLTAPVAGIAADLVVLHSLFSFIEPARHVAALSALLGLLKPGGRIVFSTEVRPPAAGQALAARREERDAAIVARVAGSGLVVNEPFEAFAARFESAKRTGHRFDFASLAEVDDLFARSGVRVASREAIADEGRLKDGQPFRRERIVAVLAAD